MINIMYFYDYFMGLTLFKASISYSDRILSCSMMLVRKSGRNEKDSIDRHIRIVIDSFWIIVDSLPSGEDLTTLVGSIILLRMTVSK